MRLAGAWFELVAAVADPVGRSARPKGTLWAAVLFEAGTLEMEQSATAVKLTPWQQGLQLACRFMAYVAF
jgi:hypothetical protein